MERVDRERPYADIILESLGSVTEHEMLQFHPDGIRLLAYVDSGDYEKRIVRHGGADVALMSKKMIPAMLFEAKSLDDLVRHYDEEEEIWSDVVLDDDDDSTEYEIHNPEYTQWVDSLVSKEQLEKVAETLAWATDQEGSHELLACAGCGGQQKISQECWCRYHENIYSQGQEWKPSEPNPSCDTCDGAGEISTECGRCDSVGYIAKNPHILLFDEATGSEKRISLNLPYLVATGGVKLIEDSTEYRSPDTGNESAYRRIRFDISSYIRQQIIELGLDPNSVGVATHDGVQGLPSPDELNIDGGYASWRIKDGARQQRKSDDYETLTPEQVFESARKNLATQFAYKEDRLKNESGVVGGEEWTLRKLPPIDLSLETFKQKLFSTTHDNGHCTLGYSMAGQEDGVSQPAFFVLDQDGNRMYRLSTDANPHASLESARVMFEALLLFERHLHSPDN